LFAFLITMLCWEVIGGMFAMNPTTFTAVSIYVGFVSGYLSHAWWGYLTQDRRALEGKL